MSKTSLQAARVLFDYLKTTPLMTSPLKPTGTLYFLNRPEGSQSEDVVVNTLTLDRDAVQQGILNVNIFVPNLVLPFPGSTDLSQPNIKRLEQLDTLAETSIPDTWLRTLDCGFEIQQSNPLQDTNNQWYLNIRVKFISLNIKEN